MGPNKKKIDWVMVVVVILALVIRIASTPMTFHGDILVQAGWGKWIFEHGIRGFYENNVWIYGWPNQPLLVNLIYSWGFNVYSTIYTGIILLGNFIASNHLGAAHLPWLYSFTEWWEMLNFRTLLSNMEN